MAESQPEMYTSLAGWFHLITAPADYAEEAEMFTRLLKEHARGEVRSVLELGSGGGNNASHMKASFALTLSDLSGEMLAVSRQINPELEHVQGDMRTLRLGRRFDAVFAHDAVDYLTSEADVAAAMATAFEHVRPGDVVLFVPDYVRETFLSRAEDGGHDGSDGRTLRYIEWTYDPDPADTTYTADFVYLMRDGAGPARVVHDAHTCGLFPRSTWLRLLTDAGFAAFVTNEEHSEVPEGITIFIGVRPE